MTRADVFPTSVSNLGRVITCAFCTGLIGIGLARFACTPLLPAIINAHWFSPSDAAYLGAANLAGYLAGAALGRPISERLSIGWPAEGDDAACLLLRSLLASALP